MPMSIDEGSKRLLRTPWNCNKVGRHAIVNFREHADKSRHNMSKDTQRKTMRVPTLREISTNRDEIEMELHRQFLQILATSPKTPYLVVIPAFNEAESLPYVASRLPGEINGHLPLYLVIDDGSSDGTAEVARANGLAVITSPVNRGQGATLKTGYLEAISCDFSIVAIVDADGQWDPQDLESVMKPVIIGQATISQGSRALGESRVGDKFRDLGVVFFASLIRILTSTRLTDTSSGIRAMSVELLSRLRLTQPQYQSSELLIGALLNGGRLAEVPVTMEAKYAGESKKGKNVSYAVSYSKAVVGTAIREHYYNRPTLLKGRRSLASNNL